MARRGDHSLEQIKEMILIAAEELVVEKGLSQLRVRNIAVKIGYTVGSIYMVFDSMTDLILHIKGRALDTISEQMDGITATNAELGLEELAAVYIRFASQNLNIWSMVFEHRLPEDIAIPVWYQQKVNNLFGKFEKQFSFLFPESSPAQKKQAALTFLGGVHGICVLMLTTPVTNLNSFDFEESIKLLVQRILHRTQGNAMSEILRPDSYGVGKSPVRTVALP
ncbi:MAG: TetR/AcrR family transcriptional regulator [Methyloglobulus sp.]|nr:TetR/AcrR family transcriptional regulator [Methyloglobulus sp.]